MATAFSDGARQKRANMTDIGETAQIGFATMLMGPLLNSEEMAQTFAALILQRLYGGDELAKQQQPLRVTDKGEAWVVMGSYQEPGMPPDTGAWYLRVRKSDCRVEEFGHYERRELSEEVRSILASRKG
jgi:hypothetical protein